MLVLTRKTNETICIGDDIRIHVVKIKGQAVKLAIEAPREMQVDRAEVKEERQVVPVNDRCPSTSDGNRCTKRIGHTGEHYAIRPSGGWGKDEPGK